MNKTVSPETRKKLSLAKKGKMPKNISLIAGWNKGLKGVFKHTEKWKKKHSEFMKSDKHPMRGKQHTEEAKKRMSEIRKKQGPPWLIGRKFTDEHRKNISLSHKGQVSPNKGKKASPETREKIRQANFKNPRMYWLGKRRPELSGANNKRWKGGITPLRKSIRELPEYKRWREFIFERDEFTCQMCFTKKSPFNVDHYPRSFAEILYDNKINSLEDAIICAEFWDTNNGRTLCEPCHKTKTNNYMKKYEAI